MEGLIVALGVAEGDWVGEMVGEVVVEGVAGADGDTEGDGDCEGRHVSETMETEPSQSKQLHSSPNSSRAQHGEELFWGCVEAA